MREGRPVILHVEDDPDLQDAMRLVLEKNGYILEEAATAEQGLRVYRETQPDLIIVDLMMEEIDAGTNLIKELQALGNTAPIYLLSSIGDDFSGTTSYADLGLSGILQKPLDSERLLKILAKKLKKS